MPSLDMCLVIHLVRGGHLRAVRDSGLKEEALFDEAKAIFRYSMEHFGKFGKMPEPATVENDLRITIPLISDVPEPVDYYISRVKERALDKIVKDYTKEQLAKSDRLNAKGAVQQAKDLLSEVGRMSLTGEPVSDWTQRTDERWAAYKEAARFKGILGIPTPWPSVNDVTHGIRKGDFWLIVGRPGTGKTWYLTKMAIGAWIFLFTVKFNEDGSIAETRPCRVLFISLEMLDEDIRQRMDSIHSRLPYTGITAGTLGMIIDDKYRVHLEDLKGKNPLLLATRRQVQDVRDLPIVIEEVRPDVVFIDGIYKLRIGAGRYKSNWEKITDIADELDMIAKTKGVPIIGTTQFNRGAVKVGSPKKGKGKAIPLMGLENLAFADALGMNPDVVVGLVSTKRTKDNKELLLQLIKNRRGKSGIWVTQFDPDTGSYDEVAPYEEGDSYGGADADDDDEVGDTSVGY